MNPDGLAGLFIDWYIVRNNMQISLTDEDASCFSDMNPDGLAGTWTGTLQAIICKYD